MANTSNTTPYYDFVMGTVGAYTGPASLAGRALR